MAQFTRIEVASVMEQTGLIPLFFNSDVDIAKKILKNQNLNLVSSS